MKISRTWLQTYFEKPLPEAQALADALTFHAFEIESAEGDILDVKVTPNRGHDCLSHRGIAKELSVMLRLPLKVDPLRQQLTAVQASPSVEVNVEVPEWAPVGAAAYMKGVKIGPSPEWLAQRLEAVGQRSINNVVDATNYVMFDIGMPTHAFAADSFKDGDVIHYGIRASQKGEQLTLLKGEGIELTGEEAVIMNASREAVDIGGVKGGATAELKPDTTEIVLSASKFEPVRTRKSAQRFNQRTEAAKRFENEMADELALYGIKAVAELVQQVAGGEVIGYGIQRLRTSATRTVSVTNTKINAVLGTSYTAADIAAAFMQLDLSHVQEGELFTVHPPFERLDLVVAEDLIEEVARIVGYDKIPAVELPMSPDKPAVNTNFFAMEKTRETLMGRGYSEVITSVFADKGERVVANKVDGVRPYLRATLVDGLREAREMNLRNKALLGLESVRLFEIGTIWKDGGEHTMLGMADEENVSELPMEEGIAAVAYEELPLSKTEHYKTFSKYPFIVRDIAMWIPENPDAFSEAVAVFAAHNRGLLRHVDLFDQFKKDGRVSYAFHLVFQSFDKTLTDEEANAVMNDIYAVVKAKGWEVR